MKGASRFEWVTRTRFRAKSRRARYKESEGAVAAEARAVQACGSETPPRIAAASGSSPSSSSSSFSEPSKLSSGS
eukprot:1577074-Pleurochrysis_carterae.AAC.3